MTKNSNFLNKLLIFSLIWIVIDGVFRKWVFPGLSNQIFVLKYVFFALTFGLHYLQNRVVKKIKSGYQFLIVVFCFWCVFEFFNNQHNAPFLVRAFGIVIHIFFIPLIMVIPQYFNTLTKVEKMIKILGYLSIPIFAIGIIQYYLPSDHILNYLVNKNQKIALVSTFTRSLSIFTFVKIYNIYLLFVLLIFINYIYYLQHQNRNTTFYVVLSIFGILNLFMTASRLPIFILGGFLVISTSYLYLQIKSIRKNIFIISLASIIVGTTLYAGSESFKESVDAFISRVELVEHIAEKGVKGYSYKDRIIDRFQIFKFSEEAGWTGFGIGLTYQGTGNFLTNIRPEIQYEEEGERIVLELGIIGGIIVLLFRLSILLYTLKIFFKIRHINYAILTLPFVLYIIPPTFFLLNVTFNYFDGFVYWFSFAMVLTMQKIYTEDPIIK